MQAPDFEMDVMVDYIEDTKPTAISSLNVLVEKDRSFRNVQARRIGICDRVKCAQNLQLHVEVMARGPK